MLRTFIKSLALLLLASCSWGQTGASAQLTGFLLDPSGLPVPGKTISLHRTETNHTRNISTQADGSWTLEDLAPGSYRIEVNVDQFVPVRLPIELTVGERAAVTLRLELARTRTETTIAAPPEAAEPTRSDLSDVIDPRRKEDLPINGRQFLDFVLLTPNVHAGRSNIANPSTPAEPSQVDLSFGACMKARRRSWSMAPLI